MNPISAYNSSATTLQKVLSNREKSYFNNVFQRDIFQNQNLGQVQSEQVKAAQPHLGSKLDIRI